MTFTAKRDIAYDYDNYGMDFLCGNSYPARKEKDHYYVHTENGSEVYITDDDLKDFIISD